MEHQNRPAGEPAQAQPTLEDFREWDRAQNDDLQPCEKFTKWLDHLNAGERCGPLRQKKINGLTFAFSVTVSWVLLLALCEGSGGSVVVKMKNLKTYRGEAAGAIVSWLEPHVCGCAYL